MMVAIICIAGAVIGLVVAMVCARIFLPIVLRSREERSWDRKIDPPLLRALNDVVIADS